MARWFLVCNLTIAAVGLGCSASSSRGNGLDGGRDRVTDGAGDTRGGCPAQRPGTAQACTGSATCTYGTAVCCGVTTSAYTCRCQAGSFVCSMTTECNFVCPDAGRG
jgi:hypothetical protein